MMPTEEDDELNRLKGKTDGKDDGAEVAGVCFGSRLGREDLGGASSQRLTSKAAVGGTPRENSQMRR